MKSPSDASGSFDTSAPFGMFGSIRTASIAHCSSLSCGHADQFRECTAVDFATASAQTGRSMASNVKATANMPS